MCRTFFCLVAIAFLARDAFADDPMPSLALVTPGTVLELEPADPPELSLQTPAHMSFASPLRLGPQDVVDQSILARWRQEVERDADNFARQSPDGFDKLFNSLSNVFDAQDIDGPLGVLSTVHIMPGNANATHQVLPFISLSQDADELDAHLRLGAGTGAVYRFDDMNILDAEIVYLQGTGDVNPQTGDETRFVLVFTHRF